MKNIEYIKAEFLKTLKGAGYESEVWLNGNRGWHVVFFRKIVRGFIFCPILSLSKKRFSNERWCSFKTFIDLKFESETRKDKHAFQGSKINPSGPIMFGDILTIEAVDLNISKEISSSKWFSHNDTFTIGNTMREAKEFIAEILPLLMNSLECAESKFDFPKPLDLLTLDFLEECRANIWSRASEVRPKPPSADDLWNGLAIGPPEQVAMMMVSFNKKFGNLDEVGSLEQFLKVEPPLTPQIEQFND